MIQRFLDYFFPMPKTMIQLAREKILVQTHVINMKDTLDIEKDQFFVVGTLTPHKASQKFDSFNVLFSHDEHTVAIKANEEVIYFFNREHEVNQIREALKTVYSYK